MVRSLKIFLLSLLWIVCGESHAYCHSERSEESLDSVVRVALDSRLAEYFQAIEREGVKVQKRECDFLIESCFDSLMRQHVALTAYEHYRDSKVMGSEAVAIHIFDTWFESGKVAMRDETEMFSAKIFATFNRQSLIGNKAPDLLLYDMGMNPVELYRKPSDRYSVLYFYDTSCATCKLQSILLKRVLDEGDFPVDVHAVYAADDMDSWRKYVQERLVFGSEKVRVSHLWDPEIGSDFQRKYGVIQTPRMFLIAPDGTILGRGLDAEALAQMLHDVFDERELVYGADDAIALYDNVFGGGEPSRDDVVAIVDYVQSITLDTRDTLTFKQMTGDLLYYLTLRRGEGFKEGLDYLIAEKVLSRPDVWKTSDDSLKVVGMAEMFGDLLSKSAKGRTVADLKVPGVLLTKKKAKTGVFGLRKLGGQTNWLMFVTEGCHVCAAEKEAARILASQSKNAKVLIINIDEVLSTDPSLAGKLFDSFDLSSLPFILETDKKGKIVRRYISFFD